MTSNFIIFQFYRSSSPSFPSPLCTSPTCPTFLNFLKKTVFYTKFPVLSHFDQIGFPVFILRFDTGRLRELYTRKIFEDIKTSLSACLIRGACHLRVCSLAIVVGWRRIFLLLIIQLAASLHRKSTGSIIWVFMSCVVDPFSHAFERAFLSRGSVYAAEGS